MGRPPALGVQLLQMGDWWRQLVEDVKRGDDIEVSSYQFDDKELTEALLGRLRAGATVILAIDKEALGRSIPYMQQRQAFQHMCVTTCLSCHPPRKKSGGFSDVRVVCLGRQA